MRIARDSGDVSSLFPPGVTSLRDMPWTLHRAVAMALAFLSFEELPKEERPPRSIWFSTEHMAAHWKWVEAKREEKYGTGKSSDIEDSGEPMERNAFLDDYYVK